MLMIQAWGSWKPPPTVVYCLSMKGKWFFRFSEITLISVKVVFCTYNTQFFAAHVWEGLNLGVGKLRRRLSWLNEEGRNWLVCVPDTGSASWSHIARRALCTYTGSYCSSACVCPQLLSPMHNTVLSFHNFWSPCWKLFFPWWRIFNCPRQLGHTFDRWWTLADAASDSLELPARNAWICNSQTRSYE